MKTSKNTGAEHRPKVILKCQKINVNEPFIIINAKYICTIGDKSEDQTADLRSFHKWYFLNI